ncbi:MAG: HEAT repeat domain-containing protein [Acidobacteria bacterium]|nr:HEAT repeat domain-containing protein [Acidobacteriota bacterium]
MLVSAPNGLETGFDSALFGRMVNRIPLSNYSLGTAKSNSAAQNDALLVRKLEIDRPSAGRYLVLASGGFSGRFIIRFKATDESGATVIREFHGDTWPGSSIVYVVHYSPAPGAKFSVTQLASLAHTCASLNVSSILPSTVQVTANVGLGPGSKGFDPVVQPVSFRFSTYTSWIPAGSFIRNKNGSYSFDETVEDVSFRTQILREGANNFVFDVQAKGIGLRLSPRPSQLLLIIGENGGIMPFSSVPCWCTSGESPAHASTTTGSAGQLVRQFVCEPAFWKQFEIGKKIVADHDKSVLPKLKSLLFPQETPLLPPTEHALLTKENVAFVFASLGNGRGFQILKEMLENRSNQQQVRYYAAHLFGDLKDPRAVPILIPMLSDKIVNHIIPWSLGQIGDRSAIPSLIRTLNDQNPDMRVLAIYALEQLDAKQALPEIRALLNDNEKIHFDGLIPVSAAANQAIAKLERKH